MPNAGLPSNVSLSDAQEQSEEEEIEEEKEKENSLLDVDTDRFELPSSVTRVEAVTSLLVEVSLQLNTRQENAICSCQQAFVSAVSQFLLSVL